MEIKCLKLNEMTESVCENNFKVRYLLPGETATFVNRKNRIILPEDVIEASIHRAKVICPIFYECGGCDFLHIKYDEQVRMKESYIKTLYFKNNIKTQFNDIIQTEKPLHYRHKVVATATTVKSKVRLGLYQEQSKKVLPFLDCYIQDKQANQVLKTVEATLNKYKMTAYHIDKNTGIIKHILIRKSYHTAKMLVVIVTNGNLLPNAKKMAQEIIKKHPQVSTIVQNIHHRKTNLVLVDEEKLIYGTGYIDDEIDGIKFRLSSRSFYQINPVQMIKLYHKALEFADISANDTVMDTYSGIGTISLLAAQKAKSVIAIESNQSSHKDALFNMKLNNINNVYFHHDDVEHFIQNYDGTIDVLMMDPTRDGASKNFLDVILKIKPKKIVYISCEPQTQIRDVHILKDQYEVVLVQPVDMFINTQHLESIVYLKLKSSIKE
ncbi:MAG: 23S rRNA (uracil(1939)-C(5))-methyltransferase RlmD [Tenericutes bacterium]|nr:23S rRNA (uracil(1939)-C(5))-methyltransferase RlmD [Mycoplasmatota bacterium]